MDLGAGLGDRLHLQFVPRHVLRDVGQDGEGGQDNGLPAAGILALTRTPARGKGEGEKDGSDGGSGSAEQGGIGGQLWRTEKKV